MTLEGRPRWCAEHLAFYRRMAAELGKRERKKPAPSETRSKTDRATFAERKAQEMAAVVEAADGPVTDLPGKVGLSGTSEAARQALEMAKASGYVVLAPGRGFVAGTTPPDASKPARAKRMPRDARRRLMVQAVQASATPLTLGDLENAAGFSRGGGGGQRPAALAVERGWLIRAGSGPASRYTAGAVTPPAA